MKAMEDQACQAAIRSFDTHAELADVSMVNPYKVQLIGIFDKLDQRGQQAVIACAAFHLRYPKDTK